MNCTAVRDRLTNARSARCLPTTRKRPIATGVVRRVSQRGRGAGRAATTFAFALAPADPAADLEDASSPTSKRWPPSVCPKDPSRQARGRARRRRDARGVRPRLGSRDGRESGALRRPGAPGAAATTRRSGTHQHPHQELGKFHCTLPTRSSWEPSRPIPSVGTAVHVGRSRWRRPARLTSSIATINGFDAAASKDALPFPCFSAGRARATSLPRQDQGARLRWRRDPLQGVGARPGAKSGVEVLDKDDHVVLQGTVSLRPSITMLSP